jgi:hypothetical protein
MAPMASFMSMSNDNCYWGYGMKKTALDENIVVMDYLCLCACMYYMYLVTQWAIYVICS